MEPRERIGRAVMSSMESIKDLVAARLVEAVQRGNIQLEQPALSQVIALVAATIETGHRQSESVVGREIQSAIDAVRLEATTAVGRVPKKKTAGT